METIKIKSDNEQGFIIINACDFDEKTQIIYGTKEPVKTRRVKAK